MKGGGADLTEVGRWDGGTTWLAHPEEEMRRASHALAVDGDVWLVDPVDAPGLDDLLAGLGEVAGVAVCLDRHRRDAATVARRHDVAVHVPEWMAGVGADLDAPVERFGDELADTGYRAIRVRNSSLPPWRECALYREADGTLVVPESVGTAPFFLAGDERLGVHPVLRPVPPRRALSGLTPERVLVGHGESVTERATEALRDALAGSRRRAGRLYLSVVKGLFTR